VLGDLPRDDWHVRGAPREDIGVGTKEVDEHHFLFQVKGGTDPQRLALGGGRVAGHLLCFLGGLEIARVLGGGVRALVGQLLQVRDKRFVER
jgi:hypothetical protein